MGSVGSKICNPYDVPLSSSVIGVLEKGPRICLNVNPSRLDIVANFHKAAHKILYGGQRSVFLDQLVKCVKRLVARSVRLEKRTCKDVRRVREELDHDGVVLLQTDKSGKFVVLPRKNFEERVSIAVDFLFRPFHGSLKSKVLAITRLWKEC